MGCWGPSLLSPFGGSSVLYEKLGLHRSGLLALSRFRALCRLGYAMKNLAVTMGIVIASVLGGLAIAVFLGYIATVSMGSL